jgi:hypothetical protein
MRVFVAGASSMRLALRMIIHRVIEEGHEVTFDWTRHRYWGLGRELTLPEAIEVSRLNREGVRSAQGVLWVVDSLHESQGAHYEAGLAEGLGKPMVIYRLGPTPISRIHAMDFPWSYNLYAAISILHRLVCEARA